MLERLSRKGKDKVASLNKYNRDTISYLTRPAIGIILYGALFILIINFKM